MPGQSNERLNIHMDNIQTIYKNRTDPQSAATNSGSQTTNCSTTSSKQSVLNTDSFPNFSPHFQFRANWRKPDMLP